MKLSSNERIAVFVGIAVVASFFLLASILTTIIRGEGVSIADTASSNPPQGNTSDDGVPNLTVDTLKEGTGEQATPGDTLSVHYTGTLSDGTVFDSSRDRGEPFVFVLGESQVILGWEIGLQGLREGGTRLLQIPPEMAYGSAGFGPIPPNATLTFEVELLEVQKP